MENAIPHDEAIEDAEESANPQDASGTSTSSESTASDKPTFDLGQCFNDAITLYQKNLMVLVFAGFLFEVLSAFTLLLLAGPIYAGFLMMALDACRREDQKVDFSLFFKGFDQFATYFLLFIVIAVASLAGLLFLIVPGLVVMTLWLYPFYFVVEKRMSLNDALGASYKLVMKSGFGLNFGLAALVFAMTVFPTFVPYVGAIVGWFVLPLGVLVVTFAYLQLMESSPVNNDDDSPSAKCGRCGYPMRGIASLHCPECGADLREVGMIPTSS